MGLRRSRNPARQTQKTKTTMIKLVVDNREIQVKPGTNLLTACLENGIYIPSLCHMDAPEHAPGSCRLCLVEIEGRKGPVPSCQVEAAEEMAVRTDTPAVRRLQHRALDLLLSVHRVDCGHCPANKKCELQKIARFLKRGLKPGGLETFLKDQETVNDHPFLIHYPNRCVLCGRCIQVCRADGHLPHMDFAHRGFRTMIHFHGPGESDLRPCNVCTACVDICPVGAITLQGNTNQAPP